MRKSPCGITLPWRSRLIVPEKVRFPEYSRLHGQTSRSDRSLLNLLRDANLCRAKNTPALFFLHEQHGPQILALPFLLQRNIRIPSEGSFAVSLRFADLAHGAHHGGMVEV